MSEYKIRLRRLEKQISRIEQQLLQFQQRSSQLTTWRLVAFILPFLLGTAVLFTLGAWQWAVSTLLFLIPFVLLVVAHRQVEQAILRRQIWLEMKRAQVARMRLDWAHLPSAQPVPTGFEHPFARDIDLIGPRSLHQLLDRSVTLEGSQRLQDWLLETEPDWEQTMTRQRLVQELLPMRRFRDRLILQSRLASNPKKKGGQKWSGQKIIAWLETQTEAGSLRSALFILIGLVPINWVLFVLYVNGRLAPFFLIPWLLYMLIALSQSAKAAPVFQDAAFLVDSLRQLGALFHFLENSRTHNKPALRDLCAPFLDEGKRPSAQLKQLERIMSAAALRYNPMLSLTLNALLPWDIYFATRMEQLKQGLNNHFPEWLDVWAELEALNSLANFGYLNPDSSFPKIDTPEGAAQESTLSTSPSSLSFPRRRESTSTTTTDSHFHQSDSQPALFDAKSIGHPLILASERIYNDFSATEVGQIFIITGSNMSGKSSFLRTLGVNVSLALAGGPVIATVLHMLPLRLFASISVTDSVADGFSFFYAEVRRLKGLLDELQRDVPVPLLFLVDEIFRGTNNRERLIGSRAYVREVIGGNGVGLIATHDLELVQLAEGETAVSNYHFKDDVGNGRMIFDYKLRPGPCPTTNALKIMQLNGLPIGE